MTTGVEDGIVVVRLDAVETKCCRELRFRVRIGFEPMRKVGLKVRLVALRIEGRLVALRRGEHNLGAGFFESVVRGGELFEPEARLAAGVAELVVRGQNHQDFHELLLYRGSDKTTTPHSPLLGLETDLPSPLFRCDSQFSLLAPGCVGPDHFRRIDNAVEQLLAHKAELQRGVFQRQVVVHRVVGYS